MPPSLKFGPKGDEWAYNRDTHIYDLSRGSSPAGFTIHTTHGAAGTSITLAPALCALVVVDMQNFFIHPRCRHHPTGLVAAERTLEVIQKCRDLDIKIVWLNWGLSDSDLETMPAATKRGFARSLITPRPGNEQDIDSVGSDMGDGRGRLLMEGSWNAKLYGPLHDASRSHSDISCAKDRISGLWHGETPLAKALESGGFRTLLFAGVNTDQCVLGTLADAYYRGWDCIMIEDCCATTTPGGQEVSIYNASKVYGFVVDSRSIIEGSLGTKTDEQPVVPRPT